MIVRPLDSQLQTPYHRNKRQQEQGFESQPPQGKGKGVRGKEKGERIRRRS